MFVHPVSTIGCEARGEGKPHHLVRGTAPGENDAGEARALPTPKWRCAEHCCGTRPGTLTPCLQRSATDVTDAAASPTCPTQRPDAMSEINPRVGSAEITIKPFWGSPYEMKSSRPKLRPTSQLGTTSCCMPWRLPSVSPLLGLLVLVNNQGRVQGTPRM